MKELHNIHPSDEDLKAMQESMGVPEDWVYRDMPKSTVSAFSETLGIIGDANYKLLTTAKYPHKTEGQLIRSQLLISPEGMENLTNFAANAPR